MTDRFFPDKQIRNGSVARPVTARVFVWLAVIAVVGSLIVCGFVISARQHFEAVTLGYQTEQLRRQSSDLEERLRRLELERAKASSPLELERRAQALGLERPNFKTSSIRRPAAFANNANHP